jgi:hypothetical protein
VPAASPSRVPLSETNMTPRERSTTMKFGCVSSPLPVVEDARVGERDERRRLPRNGHAAVRPPSITSSVPVTNAAASEAR